ncbi:hypothetical protein F4604DRAFT_1924351 [Suillus subluteus]|nr:hypothetical protein F4604DRAFT_1924351 [Suillus subluteus]
MVTGNRDSDMLAVTHVQLDGMSELEPSTAASVVVPGSSSTDSDGSCWEPLEPSGLGCQKVVETQAIQVVAGAASYSSLGVKENERAAALSTPILNVTQKTKTDSESLEIIQAQLKASRPAAAASSTWLVRKRKIDSVDTNSNLKLPLHYAKKENKLSPTSSTTSRSLECTPATIKRICWEKTGTDWKSVRDLVAHYNRGEEQ